MAQHDEDSGTADSAAAGADAFTSAKGSLAYRAKGAYAATARGLGAALTAVHLLPAQAPHRDHRLKHWAVSLTRVHDSLALAEMGVPWWTYRAIDVVDAWMSGRQGPIRVFEFGSGASTLWLADRATQVITVEHHRGFAEMMAPVFADRSNIEFQVVEAVTTDAPVIDSNKPGHRGLDFSDYVGTIDKVGGEFDVIVVDGRAREACLAAGMKHLAAGGIIVFDNSHRRRYVEAIAKSGMQERRFRGLTPTLPYPDQTSVLSFA